MNLRLLLPALLCSTAVVHSELASVEIGRADDNVFATGKILAPATNDAAAKATVKIISGQADRNSAALEVLTDGKIPKGNDEPNSNFFFAHGDDKKQILLDLGEITDVAAINTYSWHDGSRAAQTYRVFGADGKSLSFDIAPNNDANPLEVGWSAIAEVDTSKLDPGQHSVALTPEKKNSLGDYRYLLFEVVANNADGNFNNTFFSEIDVVSDDSTELERIKKPVKITKTFEGEFGDYTYILDVSDAPDKLEWATEELIPVMDEWYPKIVKMLPVDGITPAEKITFTIKDFANEGRLSGVPAYASGDSVVFNAGFMRREADGEAVGAGIHEIVHVVQFAGRDENGRMTRGKRLPTWVTEGAADWIRWFYFEPEKKGAEITERNFERSNYDGSYRTTANFFDFVIKNYQPDLMRFINASIHEGYSEEIWKEWTGKTVQELNEEWKAANKKRLKL